PTATTAPADIAAGRAPVEWAAPPDGKTAFVANYGNGTVSTIDVKTRTKSPADIAVGTGPFGVAITPDGKTSIVTNNASGTVSSIDVKTRTKNPADIPVGNYPKGEAITPDGKTAFVTLANLAAGSEPGANSVATIDLKTRTKNPTDIPVGGTPIRVRVTPDGKTAFVTGDPVAMINVKSRIKKPTDIGIPGDDVAFTP